MATLTGAQGVATGLYHAAVVTNNEDWEKASVCAGKSSGDLVVLCDELCALTFCLICSKLFQPAFALLNISAPSSLCSRVTFPRIFEHCGGYEEFREKSR